MKKFRRHSARLWPVMAFCFFSLISCRESNSDTGELEEEELEEYGTVYSDVPTNEEIVENLFTYFGRNKEKGDTLTILGKYEVVPDAHYEVFIDDQWTQPKALLMQEHKREWQRKIELKRLDTGIWFFQEYDANMKEKYHFLK